MTRVSTTYFKSDPAQVTIFWKKNVSSAHVEPATSRTLSAPNLKGKTFFEARKSRWRGRLVGP